MDPDPGRPRSEGTGVSFIGRRGPAGVFVGRQDEIASIVDGMDASVEGSGRLLLLAGEPGIGKSSLADEVARRASERGVRVLWGRCWEAGGAPAYWPWIQGLRLLLSGGGSPRLPADPRIEVLGRLLPELGRAAQELPDLGDENPEAARFRLFDSLAGFLRDAAESRPLLFIMDDAHAADEPSLLFLRFLAMQLDGARMLLLVTYRDVELTPEHPLTAVLTDLARERAASRIDLGGLSREEVARLIQEGFGTELPASLVEDVHRSTDGNPLYVWELARLLLTSGGLQQAGARLDRVPLPQGIRGVIGRRLAGLSEDCRDVLVLASLLGREFALAVLRELSREAGKDADRALEEGVRSGVVSDLPGSPGRLRFSHALVRDVLYEDIPSGRRMDLHHKASEALSRLHGPEAGPHLAEIAHHLQEAAPAGDPSEAIAAARRAAEWAVAHLAYEEAVRLFRSGLALLDGPLPDRSRLRCELLLLLGDAQMKAGDAGGSKQTFIEAAEIARSEGWREPLAEAALGYGGRFVWLRPGHDARVIALVREALAALPEADSKLRARLLARLAGALRDQADREPRIAASSEALDMARRLDDPSTLAYALVSRYTAVWGPDNAGELLEIATELVELAEQTGDRDRGLEGHLLRHKALMTLGDMPSVHRELAMAELLATELREPVQRYYPAADRATLALFEGRFGEAEGLIEEAHRLAEHAAPQEAEVTRRLQMYALRREQDRLDEIEQPIRAAVNEFPGYPLFRCVLANLYAELGREGDARLALEEVAQDGFSLLPVDNEWLFAMSLLPDVVRALGDRERAAELQELLSPYGDLNAYSAPELCLGPVWRCLGVLAATLERRDEATEHFDRAIRAAHRMGARPWKAHAQHDLAASLLESDDPEDRGRALALIAEVEEAAAVMEMFALRRRATALREQASVKAPLAEGRRDVPIGSFRREGEYWSVSLDGSVLRLRDSKGLRYLHHLLGRPDRETHVAELAVLGSDQGAAPRTEPGLGTDAGHAGELLDERAKAAYVERIRDLESELDEAERWADAERAARAREEMEAIGAELARSFGLGGRPRRGADTFERMRKAVSNRIRDAIGKIEREDPTLGKHLRAAVATGIFCSYSPERPVTWSL